MRITGKVKEAYINWKYPINTPPPILPSLDEYFGGGYKAGIEMILKEMKAEFTKDRKMNRETPSDVIETYINTELEKLK